MFFFIFFDNNYNMKSVEKYTSLCPFPLTTGLDILSKFIVRVNVRKTIMIWDQVKVRQKSPKQVCYLD